MKNLREAILRVINSAMPHIGADGRPNYEVNALALWVLQEEFNIHFREPEDYQVSSIDKPN